MTIGTTMIMAMLYMNILQSPEYVLAGMDRNVMALSAVANMLMPAAHQGIFPPPLKNLSEALLRFEK